MDHVLPEQKQPATFGDELETHVAAVERLTVRAREIAAVRVAKGKRIGVESRQRLQVLAIRLEQLAEEARSCAGDDQADLSAQARSVLQAINERRNT